jgi:hypothetical protein
MARKFFPIISILVISGLAAIFFFDASNTIDPILENTFLIDATYYENDNYVEITFEDKSQSTNTAILEILGMETSFQKTFNGSTFVERVKFSNEPKYGWQIHPVTVLVEHEELGKIGLKTEIHYENEPAPSVIYTRS